MSQDIMVSVNLKWFLEQLHKVQARADLQTPEGAQINQICDEMVNFLLSSPSSATQKSYASISARGGR